MSRQARLLLILSVMAIVAVVALAMVARQYSRFSEPTRSVTDVAPRPPSAAVPDLGPDPAPPAPAPRAAAVESAAPVPVTDREPGGQPMTAPEANAVDPPVEAQWPGFVAGRAAIRSWIEENPGPARDLVDEASGYQLGRDRINMHTFKVMQIRIRRGSAAIDAGLDEDAYQRIREQYRLWKDGGAVEPAWKRWFDGAPQRTATVDLGKYEPLDF